MQEVLLINPKAQTCLRIDAPQTDAELAKMVRARAVKPATVRLGEVVDDDSGERADIILVRAPDPRPEPIRDARGDLILARGAPQFHPVPERAPFWLRGERYNGRAIITAAAGGGLPWWCTSDRLGVAFAAPGVPGGAVLLDAVEEFAAVLHEVAARCGSSGAVVVEGHTAAGIAAMRRTSRIGFYRGTVRDALDAFDAGYQPFARLALDDETTLALAGKLPDGTPADFAITVTAADAKRRTVEGTWLDPARTDAEATAYAKQTGFANRVPAVPFPGIPVDGVRVEAVYHASELARVAS